MKRGVSSASPMPSGSPDRLFLPGLAERWKGFPVQYIATHEGAWRHRFTPAKSTLALLDTGSIGSRVDIRGRSFDLDIKGGSLAIFHPNIGVSVDQVGATRAKRILVDIDLSALTLIDLFDDDLVTAQPQSSLDFSDPALAQVMREMVKEIEQGCPNGALFAQSLSVGVALHLCRTRGLRSPHAAERGKLSPWQWTRINDLIASDLTGDLSLPSMAESVGMSKPNFVRIFRNTAGTSPHHYVVQKRLERARYLIQSSTLPLIDVASESGFASQSHLNRLFLKTYGQTPGQVRRESTRHGA